MCKAQRWTGKERLLTAISSILPSFICHLAYPIPSQMCPRGECWPRHLRLYSGRYSLLCPNLLVSGEHTHTQSLKRKECRGSPQVRWGDIQTATKPSWYSRLLSSWEVRVLYTQGNRICFIVCGSLVFKEQTTNQAKNC